MGYKRHVGVNGGRLSRIGLSMGGTWNQAIVQSIAMTNSVVQVDSFVFVDQSIINFSGQFGRQYLVEDVDESVYGVFL